MREQQLNLRFSTEGVDRALALLERGDIVVVRNARTGKTLCGVLGAVGLSWVTVVNGVGCDKIKGTTVFVNATTAELTVV